jgi:hypothetical protein
MRIYQHTLYEDKRKPQMELCKNISILTVINSSEEWAFTTATAEAVAAAAAATTNRNKREQLLIRNFSEMHKD